MLCLNRGPLKGPGFTFWVKPIRKHGRFAALRYWLYGDVEVTLAFWDHTPRVCAREVCKALNKRFGNKWEFASETFDSTNRIVVRMKADDFNHPRNRNYLLMIVTDARKEFRSKHGIAA